MDSKAADEREMIATEIAGRQGSNTPNVLDYAVADSILVSLRRQPADEREHDAGAPLETALEVLRRYPMSERDAELVRACIRSAIRRLAALRRQPAAESATFRPRIPGYLEAMLNTIADTGSVGDVTVFPDEARLLLKLMDALRATEKPSADEPPTEGRDEG